MNSSFFSVQFWNMEIVVNIKMVQHIKIMQARDCPQILVVPVIMPCDARNLSSSSESLLSFYKSFPEFLLYG